MAKSATRSRRQEKLRDQISEAVTATAIDGVRAIYYADIADVESLEDSIRSMAHHLKEAIAAFNNLAAQKQAEGVD